MVRRYQRFAVSETALCLLVLGFSLSLSSCARTRQSRSVETSGFLGDYSQLRKGEGKEAELVYINAKTDFSKYDKVLIESVKIYANPGSDFASVPQDIQQALTDHFYLALHEQLGQVCTIVKTPGPGTIRLRAAITEAAGASVALNAVTTIIPQTRLISVLVGRAADVAPTVGQAGMEAEATDSLTGTRLAAAVDRRVGAKTLRGAFSSWGDVEAAFDQWAENFGERLEALRAGEK